MILIIDDDEIFVKALSKKIEEAGYPTVSSIGGANVLRLIKEITELKLIIMDLMLPEFSGLKLQSLINRHHAYQIPIIFMSSLSKPEVILAAIDKGAVDFLMKPFNLDELILSIKSALMCKEL